MQLKLGSRSFPINEVWFRPIQRIVTGQTGRYAYIEHSWTIHDVIFATSLDDLKAQQQQREQAIGFIDGDVRFCEDDGTETAHVIRYANTLNGIRGTVVDYPGGLTTFGGRVFGSGSEMADSAKTYRYLVTQITAQELFAEQNVVFYQQSFQHSLGGTNFVIQGAFQGLPTRFNTMQSVPCRAVQQGRAISITTNPAPANTLINSLALDPIASNVTYESPQKIGRNGAWFFPTSWHYLFRDTQPMLAIPPAQP